MTCQAQHRGRCAQCPYKKDAPQSEAGESVWDVITACGNQLRVAPMGGAFALDFGAVMQMGAALGVDAGLLAEVLPDVEGEIITALADAADDERDSGEQLP